MGAISILESCRQNSYNNVRSQCLGGIFDHAYPVEILGLQGLSISQPLLWTETLIQNLSYFVYLWRFTLFGIFI